MFVIPVQVECYSGYRAEESPRVLTWQGRRIEIEEILDRWYEGGVDPRRPRADYFKVRTAEGREVLLKQDRGTGGWYLVESFRMPP